MVTDKECSTNMRAQTWNVLKYLAGAVSILLVCSFFGYHFLKGDLDKHIAAVGATEADAVVGLKALDAEMGNIDKELVKHCAEQAVRELNFDKELSALNEVQGNICDDILEIKLQQVRSVEGQSRILEAIRALRE